MDSAVADLVAAPDRSDCPAVPTLQVTLDKHTDPTCYTLQPFRGTAVGAKTIVAQGGQGAAKPQPVNQTDGKFCIEVMLVSNSANSISLQPLDGNGCPGLARTVSVTHTSCAQPDAGVGVTNLGQGAAVSSNKSPSKGDATYLNDGKTSTVVEYAGGWGIADADVKISVALAKPVELEQIVLRWRDSKGNGCDYASKYIVAYSSLSSPGQVDLKGGWAELKNITDGQGGNETYDLTSSKPFAQHVGLVLNQNGCTGWTETFALAELEIWGKDPSAVPVPPADRCP